MPLFARLSAAALAALVLTSCSRLEPVSPLGAATSPIAVPPAPPRTTPQRTTGLLGGPGDPGAPAAVPPPPSPSGEPESTAGCGAKLLLTEFLPDPRRVTDGAGEFIELYNPGEAPVPLNGFRLSDGHHDSHVITSAEPVHVPAQGTLVLAGDPDPRTNGGLTVGYVYERFHLSNQSDRIRLEDPCGEVVVDVVYPGDPGMVAPKPGHSVTRDPKGDGTRWRVAKQRMRSGDHGTPGRWEGAPKKRTAAPTGADAPAAPLSPSPKKPNRPAGASAAD